MTQQGSHKKREYAKGGQKFWCLQVTIEGKKYLVCDEDRVVVGDKTREDAASYFERSYERAHLRSYESSMSACMQFIQYCPEVVGPLTLAQAQKAVGKKPEFFYMQGVAGSLSGVKLKHKLPYKSYPINVAAGLKEPCDKRAMRLFP